MTARVLRAVAVGLLLLAGVVAIRVFLFPLYAVFTPAEWLACAVFLGVVVWWVRGGVRT